MSQITDHLTYWESALEQARSARQESTSASSLGALETYLRDWNAQLELYATIIGVISHTSIPENVSKKDVVLSSRAALRFGICCMSFPDDSARLRFQNTAVNEHRWHHILGSILSTERGDTKCRLLCAQLLSNLSTSNFATAHSIVSEVPLQPSQKEISAKVVQKLSDNPDGNSSITTTSWVDIVLFSSRSGDREVLAAVVAALHNCVASLTDDDATFPGDDSREDASALIDLIASSSLLISTVIRQLISAGSFEKILPSRGASEEDADLADSATEWICLFLIKLVHLGRFKQMYSSIKGSSNQRKENNNNQDILPEQLVLLHCIAKEAIDISKSTINGTEHSVVLGGQVGWDSICSFVSYVSEIFGELRPRDFSKHDGESQLNWSATIALLDILCSTISADGDLVKNLRLLIGTKTQLLAEASLLLGNMIDILAERSVGKKTRELKMSADEQQLTTGLVRLAANLCHRCQHNQDMLRTILVPPVNSNDADKELLVERNALHVLLSATSYATACFTLREWSVIAIRNALHENPRNQQIVADLEAQQPVQTAALASAGVRVNMDPTGKVTLQPVSEDEEETQETQST